MLATRRLLARPRVTLSCLNLSSRSEGNKLDDKRNKSENTGSIFKRARDMATKYFWPYTLTYGAFSTLTLGGTYLCLDQCILDPIVVHSAVCKICTVIEGMTGPVALTQHVQSVPQLSWEGNLALAIFTDTIAGPVKVVAALAIVPQLVSRSEKKK